jgi:hypothetical protein
MTFELSVEPPQQKVVVSSNTLTPVPFVSGIFIEALAPDGSVDLAAVVDVPAGATSFSVSFPTGDPTRPWASGTYTFKVYHSVTDGPGTPEFAQATFVYTAG